MDKKYETRGEIYLKKDDQILLLYLEELSEYKDKKETQFEYGEKTAYTECLEMMQGWTKVKKYGLDFHIEEKISVVSNGHSRAKNRVVWN